MKKRTAAVLSLLTAGTLLTGGCAAKGGGPDGVIDYWLWDATQQPGYQACADAFEEVNPGLKVRITQYGWDDYWGKLTAGFIANQVPDVFTNHLTKYVQFIDLEVLIPPDDLEAARDVKDSDYIGGLAGLWKGRDGKRYGTPKDWDTIAYFYDQKVTDTAGVTREQLMNMNQDPDDRGSFEKIIAHLSVDANDARGDEPGFDRNNVTVYGFTSEGARGENLGQTQWDAYTGSIGWEPPDKNPWGTHFDLDDPSFQKTMAWYFGLVEKGYIPSYETFGKQPGSYQQVVQGKAMLGINGSWMIPSFASISGIDLEIAPIPVGPTGHRSSPFNGLVDSITRFADNKEAAEKWAVYLGSSECQMKIANTGVVFPARFEAMERSIQVRDVSGLDVTAFTSHVKESTTQNLAAIMNVADVAALTTPGFEVVFIGRKDVSHLTEVDHQVNRLLSLTSQ